MSNGYFHREHLFSLVWIFVCIATTFCVGFTFYFPKLTRIFIFSVSERLKDNGLQSRMCENEENTTWNWKIKTVTRTRPRVLFFCVFLQPSPIAGNRSSKNIKMDLKINSIVFCSRFLMVTRTELNWGRWKSRAKSFCNEKSLIISINKSSYINRSTNDPPLINETPVKNVSSY
jgi:hypothetical protein